jgi:16S rRNA (cytosine1402-N4)-methyltransferase
MLNYHEPVLAEEVVRYADAGNRRWFVDGTLGDGGHSELILRNSGPQCRILGIDRDAQALARARERLRRYGNRIAFIHGNFSDLKSILMKTGIEKIDGLLLDLGVSSRQLDAPERGFSFSKDGPLDMRMNPDNGTTAADLLATLSDRELRQIIKEYGEERYFKRIVRAIRKAQADAPITSTAHLSQVISHAVFSPRPPRIHPATRTFQALRIAVNNELGSLRQVLRDSLDVLNNAGRILAISFHSLEDRIVKEFFKIHEKGCICPPDIPVCVCGRTAVLRVLTRKPIRPSGREIAENPRASSGRLRVAARIYA